MRHLRHEDFLASEKALQEIVAADYGPEIRVELVPRSYKPPMEELPASKHLQKLVSEAGAEMGIDIEFVTGAGGSDGNWIGSVGVPVLDALSGVRGREPCPRANISRSNPPSSG